MNLSTVATMRLSDLLELPTFPLADEYPMLEGDEQSDLASSIEANGVREPIVLFAGQILDGRNRRAAAALAGLDEVPVVEFDGTEEEADDFVIDLNEKRRHLTPGQRALIADAHRAIVAERAKRRQGTRTDLGQDIPSSLTGSSETGDTRDILAKKHNVANSYVDAVARMKRAAAEVISSTDTEGGTVASPRALRADRLLRQVKKGAMSMGAAITEFQNDPATPRPRNEPTPTRPFMKSNFEKVADAFFDQITDADEAWPLISEDVQRAIRSRVEVLQAQAERFLSNHPA